MVELFKKINNKGVFYEMYIAIQERWRISR